MSINTLHPTMRGTLELPGYPQLIQEPVVFSGVVSLEDMPLPAADTQDAHNRRISDQPAVSAIEGKLDGTPLTTYESVEKPAAKYDIRKIGHQIPDADDMTPEERKAWSKTWSDKMWDSLIAEGAIIADGPVPERDNTDYSSLTQPSEHLSFRARVAAITNKIGSSLKAGAKRAAQTKLGEKVFTTEGELTDRGKQIVVGIGVVAGSAVIAGRAFMQYKYLVDMTSHVPVASIVEKALRDVSGPNEISGTAVPQAHGAQLPTLAPPNTTEVAPPSATPPSQTPPVSPAPNPGNIELPIPPVESGVPPRPETIQLAPGETVWGRLHNTMPAGATNQDMVNELVRFFEANNLPIKWDSEDPFEAARSITPSQVLLMPK